jgi:hypothetical protein
LRELNGLSHVGVHVKLFITVVNFHLRYDVQLETARYGP